MKYAFLSFLLHTKTYSFDFLSAVVVNETSYFFFWALANKYQVSGLLMLLCTVIKDQVLDCKHLSAFPTWKGGLQEDHTRGNRGQGALGCPFIIMIFLLFSILSSKPLQGPPTVSNLPKYLAHLKFSLQSWRPKVSKKVEGGFLPTYTLLHGQPSDSTYEVAGKVACNYHTVASIVCTWI